MRKIDDVLKAVILLEEKEDRGVTASEVGEYLNLDRANVSRYLNKLYKENKIKKIEGRPVLYKVGSEEKEEIQKDIKIIENDEEPQEERLGIKVENSLDNLVGANQSLQIPIQQAKAAILYPPSGLHTLILGETGVGKSMFAEAMYSFAKESHVLNENSPFVRFNCADYADNPQLVIAQIFGVKKGAFTGADKDKEGLLKKAHGGILFLDEIHRLSPQGQEMLFTFIDKGVFRPLGETEKQEEVRVQIIAATTEDPKSYLLQTFTRRIPMTIVLPPLRERTIEERYELLEEFIKSESLRLKASIYVNKNALISFLLYDCPNNIGQLKSDIQLSCAKAFLNYKFSKKKYIIIEQSDLQSVVKKGIMKLKENREEINRLFDGVEDVLRFSYKENLNNKKNLNGEKKEDGESFYETIENKIDNLKDKGVKEEEITDILNVDIEEYFRKYMKNLKGNFRKDEILKIVDSRIVEIVEKILAYASEKLDREYDDRVYYGLALHLQGSIERIINGNKIYHPKLNSIRADYNKEFIIAMDAVKMIEDEFGVQVSLDEIGYITMFLAADADTVNKKDNRKVGVLIIMHGTSTASSMAEVANTLIGENYVEALDMPLSMKAEDMFENVKKKTKELNKGKGVLILADMGSLVNFGDIIREELSIKVKTVDMVSTLSAIEAGRKALNGRDLDSIYQSCLDINKYGIRSERVEEDDKKEIAIVTTCFTGEGSAERLKKIIGEKLHNIDNVNIIPLDILDKAKFFKKLQKVRKEYIVAAMVGTVNMFVDDIPFISAAEIFTETGIERLDGIVDRENDFNKVCESLKTQIKGVNCYNLVNGIRTFINNVENSLDMEVEPAAEIGILMHISFLVDKLRNKGKETAFNGLNEYRTRYNKEFIMVKKALKILEVDYNINIGDNEIAYIVKMILNNKM